MNKLGWFPLHCRQIMLYKKLRFQHILQLWIMIDEPVEFSHSDSSALQTPQVHEGFQRDNMWLYFHSWIAYLFLWKERGQQTSATSDDETKAQDDVNRKVNSYCAFSIVSPALWSFSLLDMNDVNVYRTYILMSRCCKQRQKPTDVGIRLNCSIKKRM